MSGLRTLLLAVSPWARHRAVAAYATGLREHLSVRFGWRLNYSPAEVERGVSSLGLSVEWIGLAYALYLSREDFERIHHERAEVRDYVATRAGVLRLLNEDGLRHRRRGKRGASAAGDEDEGQDGDEDYGDDGEAYGDPVDYGDHRDAGLSGDVGHHDASGGGDGGGGGHTD